MIGDSVPLTLGEEVQSSFPFPKRFLISYSPEQGKKPAYLITNKFKQKKSDTIGECIPELRQHHREFTQ